jgi:hypothetical protein
MNDVIIWDFWERASKITAEMETKKQLLLRASLYEIAYCKQVTKNSSKLKDKSPLLQIVICNAICSTHFRGLTNSLIIQP